MAVRPTARRGDRIYRGVAAAAGIGIALIALGVGISLVVSSWPSIEKFGLSFLVTDRWSPVTEQFGALSSVYGTLVSTVIALVIAVPLSLVIALFLVELAPPPIAPRRRRVRGHPRRPSG